MTKTSLFISFIIGASLYQGIKCLAGYDLSLSALFSSVYWTGFTMLLVHFFGEPA